MAFNPARPPVEILPNNPATSPTSPIHSYQPCAAAEVSGGDVYFFGRFYSSTNMINECGYQKFSSGSWGSYVKVDGTPDVVGFGAALGAGVNHFSMAANEDGLVAFLYFGQSVLGGESGNGPQQLNIRILQPGGSLGPRRYLPDPYSQNGSTKCSLIALPGGLFSFVAFEGSKIVLWDFDPGSEVFQNRRVIYDLATDPADWSVYALTNNALAYRSSDSTYHFVATIKRGPVGTTLAEVLHLTISSTSVTQQYLSTSSDYIPDVNRNANIACHQPSGRLFVLYQNGFSPGIKNNVVLRETDAFGAWGAEQLVSDIPNGTSRLDGENAALVVDADGTAHMLFSDEHLGPANSRWYRRKPLNGAMTVAEHVFEGVAEGDYTSIYQFACLAQPAEVSDGTLFAFSQRQGNFNAAPFTTWWNYNSDALVSAPRSYGTCLDVHKLSSLPIDHYTVHLGEVTLFGGSQATDGNSTVAAAGAPGQLFVDTSYRINGSGRLKSWTVSQVNAGLSYPVEMGTMFLVVLYRSGLNYIVRAVSPMTRNLPRVGNYEFSCDIEVLAGDYLGVWIVNSPAVQVRANTEIGQSPPSLLLEFPPAALPVAGANLGAGPAGTGKILHLFARGEVIGATKINLGRVSSGTGEDAYGYRDFVSGTNAFPEADVTSPANLFDDVDTTIARNTTSDDDASVYYYLDQSSGLVAIESLAYNHGIVGTGGTVDVLVSQNTTVAASLAGAQSIPSGEWKLVCQFPNAFQSLDHVAHIARRAKWVRLRFNPGSGGGLARTGAFEIKTAPTSVTNGKFAPHPTSGMKTRIWLDSSSHRWAPQRSNTLSSILFSGDRMVRLANDDDEFVAQFLPGDRCYIEQTSLGRGVNSQIMFIGVVKAVLDTQTIELVAGPKPPLSFLAGSKVSPPPIVLQARGVNAAGKTIGATPWIPTTGTYEQWLRAHDVFTSGA